MTLITKLREKISDIRLERQFDEAFESSPLSTHPIYKGEAFTPPEFSPRIKELYRGRFLKGELSMEEAWSMMVFTYYPEHLDENKVLSNELEQEVENNFLVLRPYLVLDEMERMNMTFPNPIKRLAIGMSDKLEEYIGESNEFDEKVKESLEILFHKWTRESLCDLYKGYFPSHNQDMLDMVCYGLKKGYASEEEIKYLGDYSSLICGKEFSMSHFLGELSR